MYFFLFLYKKAIHLHTQNKEDRNNEERFTPKRL